MAATDIAWSNIMSPNRTDMDNSNVERLPTSQIELSIACRRLINKDLLSKSDPQCFVYLKNPGQEQYYEIGKTEEITDNLNPNFVKKFIINYCFEVVQKIKFEVWDLDPLGQKDFLGRLETTVSQIVAYQGRQFIKPLSGLSQDCGDIIIVAEEVKANKTSFNLQFKALDLDNNNLCCIGNDPFYVLSKVNEDSSYTRVYKSETKKGSNVTWNKFLIKANALCQGDFNRNIKFEVFDQKWSGDHKLIGECFTTANNFIQAEHKTTFELKHPNKLKKSNYHNSGVVKLVSLQVTEDISFLDYIKSGVQIHFAVAVDYTASNGNPSDPRSLHFLDPSGERLNNYEITLRSLAEIIQEYSRTKLFAGFGFGAKIGSQAQVSHQFPLNGNPTHPYCQNIEELLFHYRNSVTAVTFFGPTNFSPVIYSTAAIAKQYENGSNFFILIIITDGIICDMPQTKTAIVNASALPMSIIIVGVGNADFSAMVELDSDDELLMDDSGKRALRDIVQFVPMNKYISHTGPWVNSRVELAREVLYEIPQQVVSYMTMKGFKPKINTQNDQNPSAPHY